MNEKKATVRLVGYGDAPTACPYVIEITTPGWRGVDAAFKGPISLPDDIRTISNLLDEAGAKRWAGSDGKRKTGFLFRDDGTTEIVLENVSDLELAVMALTRAGWLTPEVSPDAPVQ